MFHKYGGANVAVKIFISHFYMFLSAKATVKLANGNTVHAQGIGIILCQFPNCSIIYPVGPVYYFPGHPSNFISSGALNFYIGFKKVTYEPLGIFDFVDPQGRSWRSPYQTHNNMDYLQLKIININPHRYNNIVVPTVCGISKQNLSQLIQQRFGHVSITRLKIIAIKGLLEGLPENIPGLEEPYPIYILTKATKIPRVPTTDVSNPPPGFMLQIDFAFFNVESICGFTSIFWLYVLILHTHLDSHLEASVHLLTP